MAEKNIRRNSGCESDSHDQHLCYMMSQGFHLSEPEEYQALVSQAAFKCGKCVRVAKNGKNLCKPVRL